MSISIKLLLLLLVATSASTTTAQSFLRPADETNAERQTQEECDPTIGEGTRTLQTTCPRSFIDETAGPEPWDPLSRSERSYVSRVLSERLTLVSSNNPFVDDTVRGVTLEEPNKNETLEYLDNNGPLPGRYVRATVFYGSRGYIMEYLVGPLPFPDLGTPDASTITVEEARNSSEIPLTALPLGGSQYSALADIITNFVNDATVNAFLVDAFQDPSTIAWTTHEFGVYKNRTNVVPVSWFRRFSLLDNILSHPLPLEVMVEFNPYSDSSAWMLHSIVYRYQFFPTIADFTTALTNGQVNIVPSAPFPPEQPFWQTLEKRASLRPNNCDPPASNIEPGARYTVNGGWVSWLGWSFHVTNRPRTAIAIHNVKFMGDRIAYELSLQELQAVYTGYTPSMANKFLYDTNFYYGSTNRQLVEGVDCPKGAYIRGNTCIFEHDKGVPVWRKDGGRSWFAGAKGTHLVVRSAMEVGNYDYSESL